MFLYSRLLVILAVWRPVAIINCILKSKCSLWFTHTCKWGLISKVKFSVCILLCLVGDNRGHTFLESPTVSSPSTPPAQCELGNSKQAPFLFSNEQALLRVNLTWSRFWSRARSLWMWRDKSQEPYVQVGRRERIRGRRWAVQRSRRRRGLELETGKPESGEMISQGTTLVSLTNGESQLPCVYHTARSSASPSLGTSQPIASDSRVLLLKVCIIPSPWFFFSFFVGLKKLCTCLKTSVLSHTNEMLAPKRSFSGPERWFRKKLTALAVLPYDLSLISSTLIRQLTTTPQRDRLPLLAPMNTLHSWHTFAQTCT